MAEYLKNKVEKRGPNMKEYIPYDSIHIKLKTEKNDQ